MLKDFFHIKNKKIKKNGGDVSSNSSLSSSLSSSSSNKSSSHSSLSSNSTTSSLSKNSSNWHGMSGILNDNSGYIPQPKTTERFNLNQDNNSILNSSLTPKFNQVEQANIDFPNLLIFKDANTQTTSSCETCSIINLNENNNNIKQSNLKFILFMISLILCIYSIIILLVIYSPFVQSIILYLNIFKWPGDLLNLKKFGLSNARNIEITTDDGILLKGWHLLPPGINSHLSADASYNTNFNNDINYNKEILNNKDNYYDVTLANSERIVVYFHGNSMTRGFPYRVELIKQLSSQLNAHVVVIDYRGFGDSKGYPTEEGTYKDAKAVVTWINDRVISKNLNNATGYMNKIDYNEEIDIYNEVESKTCGNDKSLQKQPYLYVYGHSLGTAVSVGMVSNMPKGTISGLILDSPFSSFCDVALSHPLARPIVKIFPIIKDLMKNNLIIKYPTLEKIKTIETNVLILHGYNDIVIPIEQSQAIYRAKLSHEFLKKQNNSLNNNNNYNINLIEVEWASHSQVFRTREWLKEVPGFISNIENNYKNIKCIE
jgi:abhydrolase domain-containing protein 12